MYCADTNDNFTVKKVLNTYYFRNVGTHFNK